MVKTTTMLRSPGPIVPVVCSSGLTRSGGRFGSSFMANTLVSQALRSLTVRHAKPLDPPSVPRLDDLQLNSR